MSNLAGSQVKNEEQIDAINQQDEKVIVKIEDSKSDLGSKQMHSDSSTALKWLFMSLSEILPEILPATSGFSQQAAQFLQSRSLCIQYYDFGELDSYLRHRYDSDAEAFYVNQSTTTISADSVYCAVTHSEAMNSSFDHIWVPFSPFRLLVPLYVQTLVLTDSDQHLLMRMLGWIGLLFWAIVAFACALAALAVYPLLLVHVYLVYGFGMYSAAEIKHSSVSEQQETVGKEACNKSEAHSEPASNQAGSSALNSFIASMCPNILIVLKRPISSFVASLKGNQSVAGHVLCLPGMGSLKMLKALLAAPIDIFEAPTVRAAVEGMWSRFRFGFFLRFALFTIQVLLFSAFATWCIAQDVSYSTLQTSEDRMVRTSFIGGCVAAGIGSYFLAREVLQCCACVADEGLREYLEFWNIVQVCSHSLELASFAMFMIGSDLVSTRLVATYAVFSLWIDLLYFTKAIRQISFLLEILTTIITDMLPFTFIMMILIMAVAVALQVLVTIVKTDSAAVDQQFNMSFGLLFGMAFRMAEGRQDIAGSPLEELMAAVYEQPDIDPTAQNSIVYSIYLCFYFLLTVITVVALNALIALMGSSYEKVMEKKISQRYRLLAQIIVDEKRIMRMNILRLKAVHSALDSLWCTMTGSKKTADSSESSSKNSRLYFLPRTLEDFEKATEWTHILSASSDGKEPNDNLELWDGKQGDEWTGQMDSVKREIKSKMVNLDCKMSAMESKMSAIESKMMAAIEDRKIVMEGMESKMMGIESKIDARMNAMELEIKSTVGALEGKLDQVLNFLCDHH